MKTFKKDAARYFEEKRKRDNQRIETGYQGKTSRMAMDNRRIIQKNGRRNIGR